MGVESMAIALHHSQAKGTAKLIVVGIANHDGDGGAMPSMATLAKYGGCDVRQARRHVARLVSLGEIRVEVQGATLDYLEDHEQPNRYHFLIRCPDWCDRSKNHRDTRKGYQAPGDTPPLWKTPRSEMTGGVEMTGGPRVDSPSKPDLEPDDPQVVPQLQDTRDPWRAVVVDAWVPPIPPGPPCSVCSRPAVQCQAAQAKWSPADRHPFTTGRNHP